MNKKQLEFFKDLLYKRLEDLAGGARETELGRTFHHGGTRAADAGN